MPIYRHLAEGEWPEAMQLWLHAFGDVGWIFETLDQGTVGRKLEHTLIAEEDGKIVAAVDVFVREMRDESGTPVRVGAIGSVATYEAYRGRGLSGQLLQNSIELMQREGCAWSMLFTGLFSHYGKYGWSRTMWSRRVGIRTGDDDTQKEFEIVPLGNAGPWPFDEMAAIYESFNSDRPLTHVRNQQYWQTPIRVRLELPENRTWLAKRNGRSVAYLTAAFPPKPYEGETVPTPGIVEIAYEKGAQEALGELLEEAFKEHRGRVNIALPHEPAIDEALQTAFSDIRTEDAGWAMARPIAADWSQERIENMMASPRAIHWELDNF